MSKQTCYHSIVLCWFLAFLLIACNQNESTTSIVGTQIQYLDFENSVIDSEDQNILNYLYYYNGAGVAVADLVGDSLPDIYLVSNLGENKLFENKGNLHFEDVTEIAKVEGNATWQTGVAVADINQDGLQDIFVCAVSGIHGFEGHNELYINEGNGIFSEQAAYYGLADSDYSTAAAFFDYDLDGDLDLYLLNHAVHTEDGYRKPAKQVRTVRETKVGDRLYQNNAGKFVDVSEQAHIFGGKVNYGLAVKISDINQDGWPDIYVSNDFHENDYAYINQGNGSFDQLTERLLHYTTRFSMGNDIADINNDMWPDIFVADMQPFDHEVERNTPPEDSPEIFEFKLKHGYHPQYARNTLQLNYNGRFQEVSQLYELNATDWSWSPLIADFNLDGKQDIFISNGIWRRPNDLDFLKYISTQEIAKQLATGHENDLQIIEKMPKGLVHNFLFLQHESGFADRSEQFGFTEDDSSNGAALADLDEDGDLDLVINRLNAKAIIWENHSQGNFLSIELMDSKHSPAIGAKVIVEQGEQKQMRELFPQKGFMSSSQPNIHFGLPSTDSVSLSIFWTDGTVESHRVGVNQTYSYVHDFSLNHAPPVHSDWEDFPMISHEFNAYEFQGNPLKPYTNFGEEESIHTENEKDVSIELNVWQVPKLTVNGEKISHDAPSGFWLSATFFDADQDGDDDILLGNLGLNNRLRATKKFPLRLYEVDVDGNASIDFLLASEQNGIYFPVLWKDQLAATMPMIKQNYTDYHGFADQSMNQIFGKKLKGAKILQIESLENGWLINNGATYSWQALPLQLQSGPITDVNLANDLQTNKPYLLVQGEWNNWIPTIGIQYLLSYKYDGTWSVNYEN